MRLCQGRLYSFFTIRKDFSDLRGAELVGFSRGDAELKGSEKGDKSKMGEVPNNRLETDAFGAAQPKR